MNKDDFKIYIEDVGDISVGIQPIMYFEASINKFITDELDKEQFQKDIVDVFCKYFEPETNFAIWNSDDEKAEEEWYKKFESDFIENQKSLDSDISNIISNNFDKLI